MRLIQTIIGLLLFSPLLAAVFALIALQIWTGAFLLLPYLGVEMG